MDDETMVRDIVAFMLQQGGYDVEAAANGEQALEKCAAAERAGRPFDVAILDLTVPGGMGGRERHRRLRERRPATPAVPLTPP